MRTRLQRGERPPTRLIVKLQPRSESSGASIEVDETEQRVNNFKNVADELASYQAYHKDYGTREQCHAYRTHVQKLRLKMVKLWKIKPGDDVIEIGCGHGETSLPLAYAVGARGHVDAIDFAPPTYGSPLTIGAAQHHIKKHKGTVQKQLSFHLNTNLDTFLRDLQSRGRRKPSDFNVAVFSHSLWYFRDRRELLECFKTLMNALPENAILCLCEWSLVASTIEAVPHVQAALAQHALENHKSTSQNNIRTCLSPASIREIAAEAGWLIKDQGFEQPAKEIRDGKFEVGIVLSQKWWNEVVTIAEDKGRDVEDHVRELWEAVDLATDTVSYEAVRSMDVWWARFEKAHLREGISRPGDIDFGRVGKRVKLSSVPNS